MTKQQYTEQMLKFALNLPLSTLYVVISYPNGVPSCYFIDHGVTMPIGRKYVGFPKLILSETFELRFK